MSQEIEEDWITAIERLDKISKIEEQKAKVSPDIKQPLSSLMEALKVGAEEKEKKEIEERGYSIDFVKDLLKKPGVEIQKLGILRDFNFIKVLFLEGLLSIGNTKLNPKNDPDKRAFELFRSFIRCTYDIFEEDWDFGFSKGANGINIREIILRFSKINIKTTKDKKQGHDIKDLFIVAPFALELGVNSARLYPHTLRGFRTTVSYFEHEAQYIHSHLHRANSGTSYVERIGTSTHTENFSDYFCLGSGEIHGIFSDFMDIKLVKDQDETMLSRYESVVFKFLIQLFTIASHESLEGTPYTNYSGVRTGFISSGSSSRRHQMYHFNYTRTNSIAHLFNLIIKSRFNMNAAEKINLKITYSNGKYSVPVNSHNINEMRKVKYEELETFNRVVSRDTYRNEYAMRTHLYTNTFLNSGYSGNFHLFYTYTDEQGNKFSMPNPANASSGSEDNYQQAVRRHESLMRNYRSNNDQPFIFNKTEYYYTIEPPVNPNPESTAEANLEFTLDLEIIENYLKYLQNDINKREIRNKAYNS